MEVGSESNGFDAPASSSSAPAAAAVKTKKIDYESRVVCFMDSYETSLFAQELMNQHSLAVSVYDAEDVEGTEDTGAPIEKLPMVEAVKHPNILI